MHKNKLNRGDEGEVSGIDFGISGFSRLLGKLIDTLGELSERGGEFERSGEIPGLDKFGVGKGARAGGGGTVGSGGGGGGARGIYGFKLKVGGLGRGEAGGFEVEPFGNIRRERGSGMPTIQESREPIVDVFDEKDHVLVVAEMPGVGIGDVGFELDGRTLEIRAKAPQYLKRIELPFAFRRKDVKVSCNNGIVEFRCRKRSNGAEPSGDEGGAE